MNQQTYRKNFMVGAVAIGVIAGAAVGFITAHGMMGTGSASAAPALAGEMADMGAGSVSAPPGHGDNGLSEQAGGGRVKTSGEMGEMKGMSMEQMDMQKMSPAGEKSLGGLPGMSAAPSGAVMVPAVMRQLIGVRSAPAGIAVLGQEIRAVGTVGYDERGFTEVTVKTAGWVREVFINSIGRPVRKGEPLFTVYSPDLLATQDEYLLAVKMGSQLASSPFADVKANAASLITSTRDRLLLWDVTDTQIA